MNLSSVGGKSDGVLTDSIIQQIDIKTGLVMWEWKMRHWISHGNGSVISSTIVPSLSLRWLHEFRASCDLSP